MNTILLLEGSSLSAYEAILALGPMGYGFDILDPNPWCLARFSKHVKRVFRSPRLSEDTRSYARFLLDHVATHRYLMMLPTHEHGYLLAKFRKDLEAHILLAISAPEALEQIQSKAEFSRLATKLCVPQPETVIISTMRDFPSEQPLPQFVKLAFGTAGEGTWLVETEEQRARLIAKLRVREQNNELGLVVIQVPVEGQLETVQSVFREGELIAVHGYQRRLEGVGGSSSGRSSVQREAVVADLKRIGEALAWHGPLMFDYVYNQETNQHWFIDPNPRIGESINATLAGANLARAYQAVTLKLPYAPQTGRPAVKSHILLTRLLSKAQELGRRGAVITELVTAMMRRGEYSESREEVVRVWDDPWTILPTVVVAAQLLINPHSATAIAEGAVGNYALTEKAARWISETSGSPS